MNCVIPYRWPQNIPTVYAYRKRGNRSTLVLYRAVEPHKERANLSTVTRMLLAFDSYNDPAVIIDTDIDTDIIDWRSKGSEGYLYLFLGKWEYPSTFDAVGQCAELVVFDPIWSNGLVWGTLRVVWPYSGA